MEQRGQSPVPRGTRQTLRFHSRRTNCNARMGSRSARAPYELARGIAPALDGSARLAPFLPARGAVNGHPGSGSPKRPRFQSAATCIGGTHAATAATPPHIGCGKRTGKGNTWTESRVRSHRSAHGIAVYCEGLAERGELSLEETARRLTVSKMTVLRLIESGVVRGRRAAKAHHGQSPRPGLPGAMPARLLFAARSQKILINHP